METVLKIKYTMAINLTSKFTNLYNVFVYINAHRLQQIHNNN